MSLLSRWPTNSGAIADVIFDLGADGTVEICKACQARRKRVRHYSVARRCVAILAIVGKRQCDLGRFPAATESDAARHRTCNKQWQCLAFGIGGRYRKYDRFASRHIDARLRGLNLYGGVRATTFLAHCVRLLHCAMRIDLIGMFRNWS